MTDPNKAKNIDNAVPEIEPESPALETDSVVFDVKKEPEATPKEIQKSDSTTISSLHEELNNLYEGGAKVKHSELVQPREEIMESKKDYLENIKEIVKELFGTEKLPKELVKEMIDMRKNISAKVESEEYASDVEYLDEEIKSLTLKIAKYKEGTEGIEGIVTNEETGEDQIVYKDGRIEALPEADEELLQSLRFYFDTYKNARNAFRFKENLKDIEHSITEENKARKLNFYSESEIQKELIERLQERYKKAGFTESEFKDLVEICDLPALDKLEIQDVKVFAKIKDIFGRYMNGDKAKYIALSSALLIPAVLDGYAPSKLSEAISGSEIDMVQIAQFALITFGSSGISMLLDKKFKDFFNKNFSKEGGIAEDAAQNTAELPAQEISNMGMETVKQRIANAKESYENVLSMLSADVLPAVVTMITSAVMLAEKSIPLALGTAAGAGISMALDKYLQIKGDFWRKESKAKKQSEATASQMEEQLNAHMEIILSGLKDEFSQRLEELMVEERIASSDKQFWQKISERSRECLRGVNFIIAGAVSYLSGGKIGDFIEALVYSRNFIDGIEQIINSKRRLLQSFRDIQQMELMFNGYAAEEKEKEKDRISVDDVENSDIDLNNVSVEFGGTKILENIDLHIPSGSMVYLNGASGAGKTTLMKVIAGYYRPTSGEVQFGGVNMEQIKKSGEGSIYSKISYLPQFPYILESSIRNNLLFGIQQEIPDDQIESLLQEVGLAERFKNLDERLKGGRGDMGTTSGGESSRIGLARVLLKIRNSDSKMVFLDEPTASVDEETKNDIAEILNREKRDRPKVTFIVISHDKDFVSKLDCNIETKMKKGRVVSVPNKN